MLAMILALCYFDFYLIMSAPLLLTDHNDKSTCIPKQDEKQESEPFLGRNLQNLRV